MHEKKIKITPSSGNVFEDVGFPNAQEALAKSKLAIAIHLIIKARKLTQEEAAEIMGTDQPHVSDIVRGKLSRFTIDRLLKFLLALGRDIEITIKKHKAGKQLPRIYVIGCSRSSFPAVAYASWRGPFRVCSQIIKGRTPRSALALLPYDPSPAQIWCLSLRGAQPKALRREKNQVDLNF